eukprot:CAMPEP_0206458584 /NCGR_PEP_ID=MMETSP0324_2-20121206/23658_1 /ASSEMBLY_ACC=CAM_ASM_000836 /TAXON_ID=2866 /ORGANISM="Crypthecodinium cohnii, Strain Seligo" /LENGTH=448 /DNA_ID=CAMNT_0053929953 /DNA_START=208 /DNA_END=1554 /DNA_ORIENTATION=-
MSSLTVTLSLFFSVVSTSFAAGLVPKAAAVSSWSGPLVDALTSDTPHPAGYSPHHWNHISNGLGSSGGGHLTSDGHSTSEVVGQGSPRTLRSQSQVLSSGAGRLVFTVQPAIAVESLAPLLGMAAYWAFVVGVVALIYFTETGEAFRPSHINGTDSGMPETVLPENLWALNLAAAVGQVAVKGKPLPCWVVAALSIFMSCLQCLALFLVVHDLNPRAVPVTEYPSTPWIHSGWSVNTMKWMMVLFLSFILVHEAGDCRMNLEGTLLTNTSRFLLPKYLVFAISALQLVVVFLIIYCGVSAVLSFQAVPDILYSSMSVTFIAGVDESFYALLQTLLDVEADFTIVHGKPASGTLSHRRRSSIFRNSPSLDSEDEGATVDAALALQARLAHARAVQESFEHEELPFWACCALRLVGIAPFMFGFGLITRAFCTSTMPTDWMHALKNMMFS